MPDCIEEQITAYLKGVVSAYKYNGKACAIERERLETKPDGRYPFVEFCGPEVEIITETPQLEVDDLHYIAKAYFDLNDDDTTANHEITYLTRNEAANIKKLIKADKTCGGLCQKISVTDRGYAFELIGERIEYFVYVAITARARIDAQDSYKLG